MKLLQLVPGFGRSENGLLHYARVLEKELLKKNIVSSYDPGEADKADAIFLNYSGYGYQKRGLPVDLYLNVRRMVKRNKIPLFIYFHELYAGGNRWNQSSFWLYPLQKKLCHLFLDLSAVSFCGNEVMVGLLRKGLPEAAGRISYAGLFSNIPVPEQNRALREKVAVVFGSAGKRAELCRNLPLIEQVCNKLGVYKIIDIGDGVLSGYGSLRNISVDVKGALAPGEVAAILQSSQYGFLSYVEHLFGKSSIFAAYAGNGMTVVNFPPESQSPKDGLIRGVHYLNAEQVTEESHLRARDFSDAIFSWYQPRRAANHSKIIYEAIKKEIDQ
ncbi:MAG TPA: hypothetical protein VKQ08_05620 [Cyclobacteriaceae bacterium]|nr:hypothetical protein [Cyclobacteriaceae bacterium]